MKASSARTLRTSLIAAASVLALLVSGQSPTLAQPEVQEPETSQQEPSAPTPGDRVDRADASEVASTALPADPGELFVAANLAYEEGELERALEGYRSLLDAGYDSSAIRFNLGNTLLQMAERGEAIASYLRARSLSPRDQDVEANLEHARAGAVDDLDPPTPPALQRTLLFWHYGLSRIELMVALLVVDVLFFAALGALLLRRRDSEPLRWAAASLGVVLILLAGSAVARLVAPARSAVVVVQETAALNGLGADSSVRFRLHEGAEVRAIEERQDWLRIRLPDGLEGWIPAADAELVRVR